MSDFEHTFIAIACIGIAYFIGSKIGRGTGYAEGYSEGAYDATVATITSISKIYDLNLSASVKIQESEVEEQE